MVRIPESYNLPPTTSVGLGGLPDWVLIYDENEDDTTMDARYCASCFRGSFESPFASFSAALKSLPVVYSDAIQDSEVNHIKNSLNIYTYELERLENWIASKWLPSISEMVTLAKMLRDNPENFGDAIFTALHRKWLTETSKIKLSLIYSMFHTISKSFDYAEIVDSIYDVAVEAQGMIRTFQNSIKLMNKNKESMEKMSDSFRKLWNSALLQGRGLAHDVNNILSPMIGWGSLVQEALKNNKVYDVNYAVEKFLSAVSFLNFSSFLSSTQMAERLVSNRAVKSEIEMIVGNIPDFSLPEEHRFSIFRVIYELILNAIKYADKSKPAFVDGQPKSENSRYVRIYGEETDKHVSIFVEDNGIGMNDVEEAMKAGVRLSPNAAEGTGTGLGSIKNSVTTMGGIFHLESKLGKGTKATITFPKFVLSGGSGNSFTKGRDSTSSKSGYSGSGFDMSGETFILPRFTPQRSVVPFIGVYFPPVQNPILPLYCF